MYDMYYASEHIRMRSYDLAVDCFAIGVLYFLSLVTIGFAEKILNINLVEIMLWVMVGVAMLFYGLIISLFGYWLKKIDDMADEDTHKLI
jgi:hypothetical protein